MPANSKVILNFDNIPNLNRNYPGAVIQTRAGESHEKYLMADTVVMLNRKNMSVSAMNKLAHKYAPYAECVEIIGRPSDPSHDTDKTTYYCPARVAVTTLMM